MRFLSLYKHLRISNRDLTEGVQKDKTEKANPKYFLSEYLKRVT